MPHRNGPPEQERTRRHDGPQWLRTQPVPSGGDRLFPVYKKVPDQDRRLATDELDNLNRKIGLLVETVRADDRQFPGKCSGFLQCNADGLRAITGRAAWPRVKTAATSNVKSFISFGPFPRSLSFSTAVISLSRNAQRGLPLKVARPLSRRGELKPRPSARGIKSALMPRNWSWLHSALHTRVDCIER